MIGTVCYAAVTAAGPVRPINEDAVAANREILTGEHAPVANGTVDAEAETLFVVADGMGGHPCGDLASSMIVSNLAADPPAVTRSSCADAVRRTNLELHAVMGQRPETIGMGAVLSGVMLRGDAMCWFNVGDSRIYRSRLHDGFVQLSVDDVERSPGPSGRPRVSAALGGRRTIALINPHTGSDMLQPGDRLIICSDGITATLNDEAIGEMLQGTPDPLAAVRALLEACHRQRTRDNVSIVVIAA